MRKRKLGETRFIITDVVAIPVYRNLRKTEAYRDATQDGWGTVWVDEYDTLSCDDDCNATFVNKCGESYHLSPGDEFNRKKCFKQADCSVIITGDSCGFNFWEESEGLVKIYVTLDEKGTIDCYRLADWTDEPYEDEMVLKFDDLSEVDIYDSYNKVI